MPWVGPPVSRQITYLASTLTRAGPDYYYLDSTLTGPENFRPAFVGFGPFLLQPIRGWVEYLFVVKIMCHVMNGRRVVLKLHKAPFCPVSPLLGHTVTVKEIKF